MRIASGQTYTSCDPRGGSTIRISHYTPGSDFAHVVDSATGKRPRTIRVSSLHATATAAWGKPRRTGYVLVNPES